MEVSNARARIELIANATPTSTNVQNDVAIGHPLEVLQFLDAASVYSVRFIITEGSTANLNMLTNDTTGSDAWVAGVAQVETATAAGTITLTGNATVTVTAAGMTGSPKAISVAVLSGDTAAVWAGKVRTALAADVAVSELFTVGGVTTAISLTRKPTATISGVPFYAANDATINIALDNGTCTGITTATTSANTTAGVATSGVFIRDGDEDVWGDAIPEASAFSAVLFDHKEGTLEIKNEHIDFTDFERYETIAGKKYLMISTATGSSAISGSENFTLESLDGTADIIVNVILSN